MGNNHSMLNCASGKSKNKKKNKKKKLSEDLTNYQDAVDGLRTKASQVIPRVSTHDRELVEDRLRGIEKRYSDLNSRVDRGQKEYTIVAENMEEIKTEVDKYLTWLKEQEDRILNEAPVGYNVKEAEQQLEQQNELCHDLESRQATLERVNQKVEALLQDLPPQERETVEGWVASVTREHNKVYELASERQKQLAQRVGSRESFQTSLDKINLWLQGKEQEAQKLGNIRLASADVEKQVDKCKALQAEVQAYHSHVEDLRKNVATLQSECSPEGAAELDHKLTSVHSRYEELTTQLKDLQHHLRDCVASRKLHETDVQKVDRWCKETEMKCTTEPNLDCAIEVLAEQCKQHKTLNNTAQMFESLVKEINQRGNTFLPQLYEADKFKLQQQLKSTNDKFERTSTLVKDRMHSLEDALNTRSQVCENISEVEDWIKTIQDEIKFITKSTGPDVQDAEQALEQYEDVGEKIANYQPTITQLNQAVERLRSSGQNPEAEDILRITTQYETLVDSVDQQCKKSRQAVTLRQLYKDQVKELETIVKECEDEINEIAQSGASVSSRIDKFKSISEKLCTAEPLLQQLGSTAQQLSIDSPGDYSKAITDRVQNLRSRIDQLRKQAEKKAKQCEMIQKSRDEFETTIDEAIIYLEQKEDILVQCPQLDIEPENVAAALSKHNANAKEALIRLDTVKDKAKLEEAHYEKLGEPLPQAVTEKLQQIQHLEDSIKNAIRKKEEYLIEGKTDRMQLEMSMKQINDWLSGAEELLDSGYEGSGMDYDTLNDTLSEHKDYFSEASMCQDEMEQVMELSERLLPTLTTNDKETLRQTLKNTNQKLSTIMAASQRKQQFMENKADEWRDFTETMYQLTDQLDNLEEDWTQIEQFHVSNPEAVQKEMRDTKEFMVKIEEMRPMISELNEKSRDLEKSGNMTSRAGLQKTMTDLNDRWNEMVGQLDDKQMKLQDLAGQWDDYTTLTSNVEVLLQEAEQYLPEMAIDKASTQELMGQLDKTKQISDQLAVMEPKIVALKKVSENLQKTLPTAEAKVHSQEQLMSLLEKFERLNDMTTEYQQSLQEEIEDRDVFQNEADQTLAWLNEAKLEMQQLDPGKEVVDVMERIEKQKALEQEVCVKMDNMKKLTQAQENKYITMGKELPEEIRRQVINMQQLEADVTMTMKAKEEELQHVKVDREEFNQALKEATAWLSKADLILQERIIDVPETRRKHEALQSEFDDFKQVLGKLRTKGSDLIKHTPDPFEKQVVQKALADANRHWLALQSKTVDKSRKLNDIEDLLKTFDEISAGIDGWADTAENVVLAEPEYTDFDKVKEQLKQHRKLTKEVDQQQDRLAHLNTVVKQMEQLSDASPARDSLTHLHQRVFDIQAKATDKLNSLEETNDDIEEYETEMANLKKWMDDTRSHLTMRDATMTLKDQLAVQEKLLEDIENHKGQALLVLQKHEELKDGSRSELAPKSRAELEAEINDLQQLAREQCDTLRESVTQQESYETDIRHLTAAINEAQEKLLASPVQGTDVVALKHQIAEHNALASQIKHYQAKVNEINQKSQELSERNMDMGPYITGRLSGLGYDPSSFASLKSHSRFADSERTGPDSGVFVSPSSSLNITQHTMSDGFSTPTSKFGGHPRRSHFDRDRHDRFPSPRDRGDRMETSSPRSISGRSDDTDLTLYLQGQSSSDMPEDYDRPPSPVPPEDLVSVSWSHPSYKDIFGHTKTKTSEGSEASGSMNFPSYKQSSSAWRSRSPSPMHEGYISPRNASQSQMRPLILTPQQASSSTKDAWDESMAPGYKKKPRLLPSAVAVADLSASVPNLLKTHDLLPRERSASFGTRSRPANKPLRSDQRLAELNQSWSTLQRQLGAKERELHAALQKQERYQQAVQDVTAKMERVQSKLSRGFPSSLPDLDKQLKDYKDVLQDIDGIKEDIVRVKERGRQIVEVSDPEGYKAMQATLAMLQDRVENLQAMADDKGKQLQNAVKDKEKHNIALTAYKKRVGELEDWLQEMKIRQATTPLPTDSIESLRHLLDDNKNVQEEINQKMQLVSDLALQCDNLCEMETPANAEKLRSQLSSIQAELGNLKLAAIEKQGPLRMAIKESEKRRKEMDDYESNVKKLQQWVTDTKQLAMAPPNVESIILPEDHKDLQQALKSDLSDHRQLIRQLSSETAQREPKIKQGYQADLPSVSEEELKQRWETLCNEIAERKQNLADMLKGKDSMDSGLGSPASLMGLIPSSSTSGQLKDVRQTLDELNDLWQQLQVQVHDKQLRLDQALEFQQKYQDALQSISTWLDLAEQKLFAPESDKDAQQRVKENEALQREIKSLQGEIAAMGRSAQDLLASANIESQDLIQQSLANLNDRVRLLESQAQTQGQKLRKADQQWRQYKDEMQSLKNKLSEIRNAMITPSPAQPLDQLISNMQKIDAQLKKCENQLEDLKTRGEELSALSPQLITPSEFNALKSNYMDLQQKVMDKKADLLQSVSVQDQYEKMLLDYAEFLETAQDKLKVESVSAKDLDNLKHQLAAHKDFFSDLEVHRAMLDSLSSQCDKSTQQKHLPQHTRLTNLTYVILDKASLRGQRLDRLVRQWSELSDKQSELQRFLEDIEGQVPKPVSSDDSIKMIQDKINTYHRLQRELNEEKPVLFQVVDKGKQLLHSVNCPALEADITDMADRWVNLSTNLSHELKRTETLGDHLQEFEAEAAVLNSWLTTAKTKLSGIKHLSDKDQQSIAIIRNKVDKLLEFSKEVEDQTALKDKVLAVGNQLLQNKSYCTAGLEQRMSRIEDQWAQLQQDVSKTEEHLHQAQMDLMPSRQALTELGTWLTTMEKAVKEEMHKSFNNLADIEILLKKFKDFNIELQNKQLTVDFVNQSGLKTSSPDDDSSTTTDKTEFAERLGHLNERWQKVSHDVQRKQKSLEVLHSKWSEYERALNRLHAWFREQEDKIKKYHLIGHEVSIKQTVRDCKQLLQNLKSKEEEIESVRNLGTSIVELSQDSPDCQKCIQESLDNLNSKWHSLHQQIQGLQNVLGDMQGQWDAYHAELQNVNQILTETDYCLNRYNLIAGDISTLKIQVDKLKGLVSDVERSTASYDRLVTIGNQLTQVCEAPAKTEIQKTLLDVQGRWRAMCSDLQNRCARFEECLEQWNRYEDEYLQAKRWLDAKERLCNDLVSMREDSDRKDQCFSESKALQRDLDNFQSQLSSLYQLSDSVTRNMDPTSIANITSRQAVIEKRVMALRQILAKQVLLLQGDLSQQNKFANLHRNITAFLSQAERILSQEEPSKTTDEHLLRERYEELKNLMTQFNNQVPQLDELNHLGYRMALSEEASSDLRELNHKWQDLYSETKERNKTIQGIMLIQQDFSEKCDLWMTFLAQAEHDLATEIAGNLADLIVQQRQCEKFESDMYSKQQILHAIISDGQKMMQAGEVENKEEFQKKLQLLAEQWQSVVRRTNQRKAIIDNTIKQWQAFNEIAEGLRSWLTEKEVSLSAYEVDSVSLQRIKNLIEKIKHTQNEFKMQEPTLKTVHDQSQPLLQRADDKAQEELKVSTAQLEQHWHHLLGKLDEHKERLEGVLKQWQECEEDIEDILSWLKETRKALNVDLPTNYDELQADLHRCKDIETAFANNEDKRQILLAKERKLAEIIQPDDLNVLHQRIRLLNKQWDELRNQAMLRAQRIDGNMFRWSNFTDRVREFCDWIDQMEIKIISSKELHIEDLLQKLQKDYKEEMLQREISKQEIKDQGHALMKVSSEVRSNDIQTKLNRVDDKWQHLKAVMGFRQKKLQETLLAVQQLDVSMANLRKWLANMEHDLSGPIIYQLADRSEIQAKLAYQQELHNDIERHSAGVGSVLNLCEVLLHDSDACPSEVEFRALQSAMKNLDRRWRNICQMSPERRSRIEETWQLWQTLMADCKSFDAWLSDIEIEVRQSSTDQLNVSFSREEVMHYEDLQRRVHEHLNDLENINKQYRKLAREGRTDHSGKLRHLMQNANERWDKLQQQVSAIMRKLKHSASLKEEFDNTRDSLMNWLTDIDMQLTNIEHLSSMDIPAKVREMKRIQDEIDNRGKKMADLDQTALYLIQKGDDLDAIRVQKELEDFKHYYLQVTGRVEKYQRKLNRLVDAQIDEIEAQERLGRGPDEIDLLERQLKSDEPAMASYSLDWDTKDLEAYLEASPPISPPEKRRALEQAIHRRSVSPVRSMSPVRSSSPARSLSPRRSVSPRRTRSRSPTRTRSPARLASRSPLRSVRLSHSPARSIDSLDSGRSDRSRKMRSDAASRGQGTKVDILLEQLVDAIEEAKIKLTLAETELRSHTPTGPGAKEKFDNYALYMSDCEKSVDQVKCIERLLKTETGLTKIVSADLEIRNVIHRWELLQANAIETDYRLSQQRQDWTQFRADLDNMLLWLDQAEDLQRSHTSLPSDISDLDSIIRQHKELDISPLKFEDFLLQLESRKPRVLSINLISKNYIDASTKEGRELQDKIREMNRRWDAVCNRATQLQKDLQVALIQCQEFHHTIHDLLLWLENVEVKIQKCEPVNLNADESALWTKYRRLKDLKSELEGNQPKVISLKDTADKLLLNTDSAEMLNAKDKMHIIANRLRALLRLCSSYTTSLEGRLSISPRPSTPLSGVDLLDSKSAGSSPGSSHTARTSTPRFSSTFRPASAVLRPRTRSPFALSRQLLFGWMGPFRGASGPDPDGDNLTEQLEERSESRTSYLMRVVRTALPLQILMLLLLGVACLVPMTEEDYSCGLTNNLHRSLGPVLRYTDGPPPL